MNRLDEKNPFRRLLRRKVRNFLLAYAVAAAAAAGLGAASMGMRRAILRAEFDARAAGAPAELLAAIAGGERDRLRAAVAAHPCETLHLIVDPAHAFPGRYAAERERIVRACTDALPIQSVSADMLSIFYLQMVPPARKEAALRVLGFSPDPAATAVLERVLPHMDGSLAEEARRILAERKTRETAAPGRGS